MNSRILAVLTIILNVLKFQAGICLFIFLSFKRRCNRLNPYKLIIIGAGNRGYEAYGKYILKNPSVMKVVAVAEPIDERRERLAKEHNIEKELCFKTWEEIFEKEKFADGVIIATMDRMHVEPAIKALEKGYHVLLEKPIAVDIKGLKRLYHATKKFGSSITIAHVLRYTPFFKKIKEFLKHIGKIVGINLVENVGYFHFAHSFVRGNWRNSETSAPSILAKSCHDMDILYWLVESRARTISSFGELVHFKSENSPKNSPKKCIYGCSLEDVCPYDAKKIYLTDYTGWPVSVISIDLSLSSRIKALRDGPYGRCVYKCDNNVSDHQIVNIVFENGVFASFTMTAFTKRITRIIYIYGTHGEIFGDLERGFIKISKFAGEEITINVEASGGHSGGDEGLMKEFLNVLKGNKKEPLTSIDASIESHIMALAAEKSRKNNGKPVEVNTLRSLVLN